MLSVNYILVDLPWTAKPPLISGSQSSSFCRAPEVTTYRVFYHISKSFRLRDIESKAHLGICLNFKPTITQVTFTPKGKGWSRKVCANLLLLRVITYSHTDMIITCATVIFQVSGSILAISDKPYHQILKGSSNRVINIP